MPSHKFKTPRGMPARGGDASAAPAGSTALLILGMHRSGTSALAGATGLLGADLGTRLVEAAADNPTGYWEHADAVAIHERLLHELDSSWEDVRDLPKGWANSAAATRAKDAIESLVRDEFAGKALWAVKDPRMCRFVPLWLTVLHDLSIRPAFMVIARHPDEVARSLGVRDRLGAEHARLLWLRTMVDVEADTRGHDREMLSYDALLSTPVAVLDGAARRLAFDWPLAPNSREQALGEFLAEGRRHHRLRIAETESESGEDGKKGALGELFGLCRDGPQADAWKAIAAARPTLKARVKQVEPWVGGLMSALARVRTQLQETQRRFVETDAALSAVHQLSLSRLDEMGKLDARLADTQAALEAAQALSIERLAQVGDLDRRLAATSEALARVDNLSRERLATINETQAALEVEQARSLQRLEQLGELDRRLGETDAAFREVEALSLQRLQQLAELDRRLRETDAAFQVAEKLSLQRLAETEQLDAELAKTREALRTAQEGLPYEGR